MCKIFEKIPKMSSFFYRCGTVEDYFNKFKGNTIFAFLIELLNE